VARQRRRTYLFAQDGGGIDIRELTDADIERVDAVLPLSRLDGAGTYLVAWEQDEPVGHAHVAWENTKLSIPAVQDVFVRSDRRRHGVATELMRAAERLAAKRGHRQIGLSYGAANEAARRLYEKLGYRDAGIPPERVRGTIVIRSKSVEVDDTLVCLIKGLPVDSGRPRSS
jgi:GNAT superfamily N-acetyltransferase